MSTESEADTETAGTKPTFEEALSQLEAIVHDLEDGQVGLSEALVRYERGVGLLRECYGLLSRAERRIELLTAIDASGKPQTESLDDESSAELDAKGTRRTRRRVAPKPAGGAELRSSAGGDPVDEPPELL